ncbi:hypothetical protein CLV30_1242 [Haloactinopolyspora alba]|uniref:Amidohydrolase family protein n=1 Tax=Haloactinopolyspora alba TaxID=648780 RepID=A0A2P8DI92_9ACTN|nr:hypothetical protein [Haloactinopolyspora alba]PSK96918.1 hypothetical protein CLV30_1242 [Haloactinopolyspora alba]
MILDCDLLVGRDVTTSARLSPADLATTMAEAGIDGGAVGSLRALSFDPPSGNDEAHAAAPTCGARTVAGVDLRDPLGAEREIDRQRDAGVRIVRLAPARQGVPASAPGLRACARRATRAGMLLLVEGDVRLYGPPLAGLDAAVVFVDLHFYQLGDFVVLGRDEPGFHASTRLLGNPDGWETVLAELGAQRLVFGARTGWFEARSVLTRLDVAGLDADARELVTARNLLRLIGEDR